jgi:hypothetical protein
MLDLSFQSAEEDQTAKDLQQEIECPVDFKSSPNGTRGSSTRASIIKRSDLDSDVHTFLLTDWKRRSNVVRNRVLFSTSFFNAYWFLCQLFHFVKVFVLL